MDRFPLCISISAISTSILEQFSPVNQYFLLLTVPFFPPMIMYSVSLRMQPLQLGSGFVWLVQTQQMIEAGEVWWQQTSEQHVPEGDNKISILLWSNINFGTIHRSDILILTLRVGRCWLANSSNKKLTKHSSI